MLCFALHYKKYGGKLKHAKINWFYSSNWTKCKQQEKLPVAINWFERCPTVSE